MIWDHKKPCFPDTLTGMAVIFLSIRKLQAYNPEGWNHVSHLRVPSGTLSTSVSVIKYFKKTEREISIRQIKEEAKKKTKT